MAGALASAYLTIQPDLKKLKKGLAKAHDQVKAGVKKMAGAIRESMNTAFRIGAIVAGAGIGAALTKSIKDAIDNQSVLTKFNAVFKGMTEQANKFAKTLQESFYYSGTEAMQMLASIQDMLVPMGVARKEAGQMSFEMAKLARILAAWRGESVETVINDMSLALAGSTRTMNKYGIVIRESSIAQQALKMGLAGTKEELTQADKAAAIFKLMMKGSADAIAAFAQISQTVPEKIIKMRSRIDDMSNDLGDKFLKIVNSVVNKTTAWVEANRSLIADSKELDNWIAGLPKAFDVATTAIRLIAKAFWAVGDEIAEAMAIVMEKVDEYTARWERFKVDMINKFSYIEVQTRVIWSRISDMIREKIDNIVSWVSGKWEWLKGKLASIKAMVSFLGEGSATKPLSIKVREMSGKLEAFASDVESANPKMTVDFSPFTEGFDNIIQQNTGRMEELQGGLMKWYRGLFDLQRQLAESNAGIGYRSEIERSMKAQIEAIKEMIRAEQAAIVQNQRLKESFNDLWGLDDLESYFDNPAAASGTGGGSSMGGGSMNTGGSGGMEPGGGGGSSMGGGTTITLNSVISPTVMTGDPASIRRAAEAMGHELSIELQKYGIIPTWQH